MAEECQYYHYDSSPWGYGYTCLLKQSQDKDRTIDSDWVHKYCWNYNYNDCPFYQAKHLAVLRKEQMKTTCAAWQWRVISEVWSQRRILLVNASIIPFRYSRV